MMTPHHIDIEKLNKKIRDQTYMHPMFKNAFKRVTDMMMLSAHGLPGSGLMVYGPSGVGKSHLTHAVAKYGEKTYGKSAVMRTQLNSSATIKGVISGLLSGLGDPRSDFGTTTKLIERLKNSIVEHDTKLIIIDELQHLIPGGSPSQALIDNILNAFKVLDETRVSFLLCGTEEILSLWKKDKQIRSRFQVPQTITQFQYPEDRPHWRGIVLRFVNVIVEEGFEIECPDLDDRLYTACKGEMRPLTLILMSAVTLASKDASSVIKPEHFRLATKMQIDDLDGSSAAFDLDLRTITRLTQAGVVIPKPAPAARGLGGLI